MGDRQASDWRRKRFKGNKVWVETDDQGRLRLENNLARIKYQLDQPHEYRVHPSDLHDLEEGAPGKSADFPESSPEASLPPRSILIYTDGASSGNPGPAGIGVVMRYGPHRKEISRYIGTATNNIAELEAVKAALEALRRRDRPVRIHTDSGYVHGLLEKGWKAKGNPELVDSIRRLLAEFADVAFIKVPAHQGVEDNELADRLATDAIRRHRDTRRDV